ncbi:cytochrome c maturation protein CcmE [Bowmanella sp. JS7-9]|uniref:Cytochrome c-type biogenesis protein CcmE n=1 Tax=Pseudobowmanella zhangzhouensis TaxID=1537679 RepID=A0ABW1XJS6_9ALTE|nr:cytochrome c maturation protein CcmE [Bowmanella sp. JS7-9]TBX25829.1 cytochrome C biogenesis protein CcmE [Bowmanella sp. JS7-9]
MNPRRKSRLTGVLAIMLLVAGAIYMVLSALSENMDMFLTPSEVIQGKNGTVPKQGQRLKVGGMVIPGTVTRDEESLKVAFSLTDTGPVVRVEYEGLLPDLFREGQGIVVTGTLAAADLVIADEVLAKHDEEYMPPELAEKMKGIKHVKPQDATY